MRREEAQTAYAAAKQLGKVAALLDQQRPNIFTQAVANIMPGQKVRIVISYVETLKYELGLKFKLMTQFTSFVAIDDVIFTGPEDPARVNVPSNLMAGRLPMGLTSGVAQMVTVTASAETINSTTASITHQITGRSLADLPVQGRSFESLLTLTPGTVPGSSEQFVTDYWKAGASTNGQRANANMFVIDGVSANFGIAPGGQNPGPSAAGSTPAVTAGGGANGVAPLDSTQEITVQSSYTQPEYGRVPGAQVNVVTHAGTNEFHGTLFHFFGNDSLDANDWFANSRGLTKPPRRLNNFGGTFGGPIERDSLFFFGSYEGLRLRKPMVGITDVPSLLSRTTAVPGIQPFLNAFPVPTGDPRPDGFAEFAATFANAARHDLGSFRLDWSGKLASISGKYSFADSDADRRGAGGFSLNTARRIRSQAQTFTGSFNKALWPTHILDVRANYSRLRVAGVYGLDGLGGAVVPSNLTGALSESFNFDLNVYMFPTSFGFAYFRPDVIAGEPLFVVDPAAPLDLQQGNLGRNSLRGFPLYQIDMALRRRFNFTERLSLQIQADAFNLFNHSNFEDPLGHDRVFGSAFPGAFTPNSTFGRSSSLLGQSLSGDGFLSFYNPGGPRALRFSIKLIF